MTEKEALFARNYRCVTITLWFDRKGFILEEIPCIDILPLSFNDLSCSWTRTCIVGVLPWNYSASLVNTPTTESGPLCNPHCDASASLTAKFDPLQLITVSLVRFSPVLLKLCIEKDRGLSVQKRVTTWNFLVLQDKL